jgi:hypothetical protein
VSQRCSVSSSLSFIRVCFSLSRSQFDPLSPQNSVIPFNISQYAYLLLFSFQWTNCVIFTLIRSSSRPSILRYSACFSTFGHVPHPFSSFHHMIPPASA